MAIGLETWLSADLARCDHIASVFNGTGLEQRQPVIFAGVQGKVGRAQENIGSLQSHDAKQFTKAHVIADGQTQMTNFFGVHCNDVLAGADPVGLPDCGTAVADGHVKGMEFFVVGSQLSLGSDDHGAVVGAFLTALGVLPQCSHTFSSFANAEKRWKVGPPGTASAMSRIPGPT